MGNASVKGDGLGDGGNNPSQEIGYEEQQFHGQQHMEEAAYQSSGHVNYHEHEEGSSEMMTGQSPPDSPRAARFPAMFTPQVPMVPLQRPDEMDIPGHAWTEQSDIDCEDMFYEQGIPTMITWSYGGKQVALEGSWDDWKTKKPLQRSGKDFSIMKVLPSGVYQYRFLVDGQWRYSPDFPLTYDDMGNAFNILDLQDYVPEDLKSIAGFEPPQSPDSSYGNMHISEDYSKEPPLVPPHLQMTLLNVPSSSSSSSSSATDNQPSLARPPHVVLNHLYVQKGKSGQSVVALGSTNRFRAKYVTVVLYKSLQR